MGDEPAPRRVHYTPAGWVPEPEGAAKRYATQKDVEEVTRRLTELHGEQAVGGNFVGAVVFSLAWDLDNAAAAITGLHCDQWCGVSAAGGRYTKKDEPEDKLTTWMECDTVEHGIAATWLAFVERYGLSERE